MTPPSLPELAELMRASVALRRASVGCDAPTATPTPMPMPTPQSDQGLIPLMQGPIGPPTCSPCIAASSSSGWLCRSAAGTN